MRSIQSRSPILGIAIAVLIANQSASAATVTGSDYLPAAYACQGSLPAFAGTLRARPLAIQNEGNSAAFVTCGGPGGEGARSNTQVILHAQNNSASPISISCTFVHGWGGGGSPTYVVKTTDLNPGSAGQVAWLPSDFATTAITRPQINCALPPGGAVLDLIITYTLQVGA